MMAKQIPQLLEECFNTLKEGIEDSRKLSQFKEDSYWMISAMFVKRKCNIDIIGKRYIDNIELGYDFRSSNTLWTSTDMYTSTDCMGLPQLRRQVVLYSQELVEKIIRTTSVYLEDGKAGM